jgi:4-hydroxybenzoate polyprenyltransferase
MLELSPQRVGSHTLTALVRALRPYQWVKNLLVVVPTIAAHRVPDAALVQLNAMAFGCFCLAASGVYLANDVFDIEADRLHPRKRLRPVASGELPIAVARALSVACIAAAVLLAWTTVSREFAAMVLLYVAAAGAYSTRLKREPIVDVFLLAALYVVRVIAGGIATDIPISSWLLAFAMFLFLSLAFVKRYTELFLVKGSLAGRGYVPGDDRWLPAIGISSGYMAVLVLALYVNSTEVARLYSRPASLWWLCPLLLFWVTRLWFRASREMVHDDPVIEALRDPLTYVLGAVSALILYTSI